MISKSLSFGIQNYFIVAQDETALDYNYYGFVEKKGSTLLMRTNKTATEIRYFVSPETFSTIWAVKATKAYTTPDQLTDPKV